MLMCLGRANGVLPSHHKWDLFAYEVLCPWKHVCARLCGFGEALLVKGVAFKATVKNEYWNPQHLFYPNQIGKLLKAKSLHVPGCFFQCTAREQAVGSSYVWERHHLMSTYLYFFKWNNILNCNCYYNFKYILNLLFSTCFIVNRIV